MTCRLLRWKKRAWRWRERRYVAVDRFCYLGDMLSVQGGVDTAVTIRVACAWQKLRELSPFLTSKASLLRMKGEVYTACVRSCLLHGCEMWAMRTEHNMKELR